MCTDSCLDKAVHFTILTAGLFAHFRDDLARLSWYRFRNAKVSLLLNKSDPALAMFIGNYYFGGSIRDRVFLGRYQLAHIYFMENQSENALSEINKEMQVNFGNGRALY